MTKSLLALLAACGALGVAMATSQPLEPNLETSNSMAEPTVFLPDDEAAARFQSFFADFGEAVRSGRVTEVYAEDAYFNDTLKEIRGAGDIEDYFLKTLEMATRVDVRFEDLAVSEGNYYFRWEMDVEAPKLNGGEVIRSQGMSHIVFDANGKVAMHRDYWDASSGLFEHVPVLGGMIRWVKGRL